MTSGERTCGTGERVDRLDRATAKPQVATLALLVTLASACGDDRRPRPVGEDGGVRACATELRRDSSVDGVPLDRGLSAVVALSYCDAANTGASDVAGYVKVLVQRWAAHRGQAIRRYQRPNASRASIRQHSTSPTRSTICTPSARSGAGTIDLSSAASMG